MRNEMIEKLDGDTKVLYEGFAENVKAMDKTHKKTNLIRIIAIMGFCVLCTILYCIKVDDVRIGLIALLVIICAYASCAEVINAGKFKKVKYYITEKHIATDLNNTVSVVPLDTIDTYDFKKDEDGMDYLVCGNIKKGMYGLRSLALLPARTAEDGKCEEFVAYAMSDFDKFKLIFNQQIKKD